MPRLQIDSKTEFTDKAATFCFVFVRFLGSYETPFKLMKNHALCLSFQLKNRGMRLSHLQEPSAGYFCFYNIWNFKLQENSLDPDYAAP